MVESNAISNLQIGDRSDFYLSIPVPYIQNGSTSPSRSVKYLGIEIYSLGDHIQGVSAAFFCNLFCLPTYVAWKFQFSGKSVKNINNSSSEIALVGWVDEGNPTLIQSINLTHEKEKMNFHLSN